MPESNIILKLKDNASKGLGDVGRAADTLKGKVSGLDAVGKNLSSMGDKLTLGLTGPIMAVGGAIAGIIGTATVAADRIDKMAQRTGIGAERLQGLGWAAEQSGASLADIESVATRFSARLNGLEEGSSATAEAFQRLGIATTDSAGQVRGTGEVFEEALLAIAAIPDEAERGRAAIEVFGASGAKLRPLLNNGVEGIEDLIAEAERLGIVLPAEAVTAFAAFGDEMNKVKRSLEGARNQIAASFLPLLQDHLIPLINERVIPAILAFSDKIVEIVEAFVALDEKTQGFILGAVGVAAAIGPVLSTVGRLTTAFNGVVSIITRFVLPIFGTLASVLTAKVVVVIAAVVAALAILYTAYRTNFLGVKEVVDSVVGGIVRAFDNIVITFGAMRMSLNSIKEAFRITFESIGLILRGFKLVIEGAVIDPVVGMFEPISASIRNIAELFGSWVDTIAEFLRPFTDFLNRLGADIGEGLRGVGNRAMEGINRLIGRATDEIVAAAATAAENSDKVADGFELITTAVSDSRQAWEDVGVEMNQARQVIINTRTAQAEAATTGNTFAESVSDTVGELEELNTELDDVPDNLDDFTTDTNTATTAVTGLREELAVLLATLRGQTDLNLMRAVLGIEDPGEILSGLQELRTGALDELRDLVASFDDYDTIPESTKARIQHLQEYVGSLDSAISTAQRLVDAQAAAERSANLAAFTPAATVPNVGVADLLGLETDSDGNIVTGLAFKVAPDVTAPEILSQIPGVTGRDGLFPIILDPVLPQRPESLEGTQASLEEIFSGTGMWGGNEYDFPPTRMADSFINETIPELMDAWSTFALRDITVTPTVEVAPLIEIPNPKPEISNFTLVVANEWKKAKESIAAQGSIASFLGEEFDELAAQAEWLTERLRAMLEAGADPNSNYVQYLYRQLEAVNREIEDTSKTIEDTTLKVAQFEYRMSNALGVARQKMSDLNDEYHERNKSFDLFFQYIQNGDTHLNALENRVHGFIATTQNAIRFEQQAMQILEANYQKAVDLFGEKSVEAEEALRLIESEATASAIYAESLQAAQYVQEQIFNQQAGLNGLNAEQVRITKEKARYEGLILMLRELLADATEEEYASYKEHIQMMELAVIYLNDELELANERAATLAKEMSQQELASKLSEIKNIASESVNLVGDLMAEFGASDQAINQLNLLGTAMDDAFSAAISFASGDIIGGVVKTAKAIFSVFKWLSDLFKSAATREAERIAAIAKEMGQGVASAISGAMGSAITGWIKERQHDIEKMKEYLKGSIYEAVLDGIIEAMLQKALIEATLAPIMEDIIAAALDKDMGAVESGMGSLIGATEDFFGEYGEMIEQIMVEFGTVFDSIDAAKKASDKARDDASKTIQAGTGFGQFVSQAVSIPLLQAAYVYDTATRRFENYVNKLVDDGIRVDTNVNISYKFPRLAGY